MATLATGGKIPLCEIQSGAIIVRGRSPRNFQSRKDMPLNGSTSHARKASHLPAQISRTSTGESSRKADNGPTSNPQPVKTEPAPPPPPMSVQSFYDPAELQMPANFFDDLLSTGHAGHGALTALPPDPVFDATRNFPNYAATSPDLNRNPSRPAVTSFRRLGVTKIHDVSRTLSIYPYLSSNP
ncbi:hypothetical protein M8818_007393 [Zalaria obscura]|uniref:Uncharacterized protein n=1 Tax=Zalaria obscura TaxID=2024903 RepID=A0ACC3S606_9PEZI